MVPVLPLVRGPLGGERQVWFALDTGTPVTILSFNTARELDLTEARSVGRSHLMGPTGPEEGYRVIAPQLQVMGRSLNNLELHCHKLDVRLRVQGVLGLDVLRHGELRLNLPKGLVQFEWAL